MERPKRCFGSAVKNDGGLSSLYEEKAAAEAEMNNTYQNFLEGVKKNNNDNIKNENIRMILK